MPGKPVTDQQVRLYMHDRPHHSRRVAAARAGFSERTARRIEADPRAPSQRRVERGRTVPDPLAEVWETVLLPILERDASVQAVTLLRHLQMTDPDTFPDDRVRRTLERRVRDWRALHGPPRDVIFRQNAEPGRMALSDFTDASELGVTLAGKPFPHRLHHFVLDYSGWESAGVVPSPCSDRAVPRTARGARVSRRSPRTSRTRSGPSAASRASIAPTASRPPIATSTRRPPGDVTRRYEAFSAHYGLVASRCNPGEAHENGAVESHHRHLKTALDQALILRGDGDFATLGDYRTFVDQLVVRRNRRREAAVRVEMAALRPLPARRATDFTEIVARVTRTGGFLVHSVFYSAPARLIGHRLRVHVYDDRIEAWLGATKVVAHPRRRGRDDGKRVHQVDYRHMIHALRRKPQALARSVYRDSLFPRTEYAEAWTRLSETLPEKEACRRMVALLALAHDEACEAELAALIAEDLAAGRGPDARDLRRRLEPRGRELPTDVPVALTELASFDLLMGVGA